ncbi:MAG TPA: acyl-CoA synthetase [Gemmatimonadaceae bacterium]|nr:acyl-CoA synthetase [Gemmatimonadaceae bacterium]
MSDGGPAMIQRAERFAGRIAIVDAAGEHTYGDLLDASARVAGALLDGRDDLAEERVCFHVPPGFQHVAVQWGIWRAGGMAVPLALSHPVPELEYTVGDSDPAIVVAAGAGVESCRRIAGAGGRRFLPADDAIAHAPPRTLPEIGPGRRAMMVYTSGTTGRPRGVVTTHASLGAQITTLVDAWAWTADDRILLVLPLHHVHGIVNVVGCALWSGATCEMLPAFDADVTWDAIASGRLTLFMAVPTIYRRLIDAYHAAAPARQAAMREGAHKARLMVSGSAALPVQTLEEWRAITGHTLLERYGMTEIGMALSNPLEGQRRPGAVGAPLPGVDVRIVNEEGQPVAPGEPGSLEVRGPTVFQEYWRRPEATRDSFRDEWFVTGDHAVVEDGAFRLLGRSSVDILKTGGYKVSALEIEEVLREHPSIREVAVVGVADPEYGERVSAAVELKAGASLALDELVAWGKERLAPYKVPRALRTVSALPRNAMGKVMKPEVAKLFT